MDLFSSESIQNIDIRTILIFSSLYFVLFIVGETAYHVFKIKAENTRKFVHLVTGIIALFFPIYFKNPLDLLIICAGFIVILVASVKLNALKSVNAIDRPSRGSILFPITVIICYFVQFHKENYIYYFIPILILAIADPLAALIGQKFPYKKFSILGNSKTLSGSLGFFVASLIITVALLLYSDYDNLILAISCAVTIAVVTTVGEAISIRGYDNLIVPLLSIMILLIFRI